MAAPLSGVGQQQQVPVSQTLQPISNDENREVRRQEQEPDENQLQVREAPAAQTQESDVSSDSTTQAEDQGFSLSNSSTEESETQERGSVVDITI